GELQRRAVVFAPLTPGAGIEPDAGRADTQFRLDCPHRLGVVADPLLLLVVLAARPPAPVVVDRAPDRRGRVRPAVVDRLHDLPVAWNLERLHDMNGRVPDGEALTAERAPLAQDEAPVPH